MLDAPQSFAHLVDLHRLTALASSGETVLENGDLPLTKDGDLRFGSAAFDAMFRLVEAWRYTAPAMRLMHSALVHLQASGPAAEARFDAIFEDHALRAFGRMEGVRGISPDEVEEREGARDVVIATELGREALAGSLLVLVSSLLERFRDDLEISDALWTAGMPRFAGCSLGQIVVAAGNAFRHRDEWIKARAQGLATSRVQQRSMNVIRKVRGLPTSDVPYYANDMCEATLIIIIGGQDFSRLEAAVLGFANDIASTVE